MQFGLGKLGRGVGRLGNAPSKGVGRASYLGVVATRGHIPHRQNPGVGAPMFRSAHIARDDITALKIVNGNWFVNEFIVGVGTGDFAERGTGHTQTLTASVEYPAGTFTQVKWGGVSSIVEADGATSVSDFCNVTIPAGATFFINRYKVNPSGCTYFNDQATSPANTALGDKTILFAGADSTMTGFSDANASSGYVDFPLAIVAMTRKGTVGIIGSSRCAGLNDTSDATGDLGYARGVGGSNAYIQGGVASDSLAKLVASSAKRAALINAYCTHVLLDPANDDVSNLTTWSATVQSALALFPNLRRVMATETPHTTGAWTLVNQTDQTIAKQVEGSGSNPYLRTAPNIAKVLDFAAVAATGVRGNQYWNADGTSAKWTSDGLHESKFANQQLAASVPASTWA